MSFWDVSSDVKKKVLDVATDYENDKRILFILKNLGPQRFTDLERYCDVSRSTVSKYLRVHSEQGEIEKKIFKNEEVEEARYFITKRGEEKLIEDAIEGDKTLFLINELTENIQKLSEMVEFYKEIGVDETIMFQIVNIILKIGDKFFTLPQNRDLYLTLFYMINYNSILTPDYKLNLEQFCEVYDIKNVEIKYFIEKIMANNLGFFMFVRDNDVFFFHEEDLLGTTTLRLVRDHLIQEIIHLNLVGPKDIYDLDKEAGSITKKVQEMGLIWEAVREQFEILIKKLIIKNAVQMGISKTFLTDLVVQSEKIKKHPEVKRSLINIIEGSDKYEDFNIIEVSDVENVLEMKEKEQLDKILGQVKGKGFCPNCGKIILENDFSNKCTKCGIDFKPNEILKEIDRANEASIKFKALKQTEKAEKEQLLILENLNNFFENNEINKAEALDMLSSLMKDCKTNQVKEKIYEFLNKFELILIRCPNSECGEKISVDWQKCPWCQAEVKQD